MEKQKILLVEDDLISGFIAEQVLKKSRFAKDYHWVKNGMDAVKWLSINQTDLVLLDLSMPVMDGFDVLETLENNHNDRDLKIVVLTSSSRSTDKEKCLKYTCVKSYLEKPLSEEKFDKMLRELDDMLEG